MKRLWKLMPLLALLTLTIGCTIEDKDNPVIAKSEWNVTLNVSPSSHLVIPSGNDVAAAVTAFVTKDGVVAQGVSVSFSAFDDNSMYEEASGSMLLTPQVATTDSNGLAKSTLSVASLTGAKSVSIHCDAGGNAFDNTYLYLRCTGTPSRIAVSAPAADLLVAPNQSGQLTFSVSAIDSGGVMLKGVPVKYRLESVDGGSIFGTLSGQNETADTDYGQKAGIAMVVFDSQGGLGKVKLVVETNYVNWNHAPIVGEMTFEVKPLGSLAGSLALRVSPSQLLAVPDSLVSAKVVAQVTTADHRPLSGVYVRFSTDLGSLTGVGVTNALGVAEAIFTNNFNYGTAHITGLIPGTAIQGNDSLVILPGLVQPGSLRLYASHEFIYANNGLTPARITAVLNSANGDAVPGAQINFTAEMGAITSPVTTDSMGAATAYFRDFGIPSLDNDGNLVPVPITANFAPWNLSAEVEVTIKPLEPVATLTLVATRSQVLAGNGDTVSVRATGFLQNGSFAPIGTVVNFWDDSHLGRFVSPFVVVGQFGVAEAFYLPGDYPGVATLHAMSGDDPNRITSNGVDVIILPEPANRITVVASPNILDGTDPDNFSTIRATVSAGQRGYPVGEGVLVTFTASAGEITPAASTDSLGVAQAIYRASGAAGDVTITAKVQAGGEEITGTGHIIVNAGLPNEIELKISPENISLAPSGTASASAIVRDFNGNRVAVPTTVMFELLGNDAPEGESPCNINNRGSIDSALTINGEAVVSVNAGTFPTGVVLRAYTWRDPDSLHCGRDSIPRTDIVSVINSRLAVVGGPAHNCDVNIDSRGEDVGGGIWELEVACHVYDRHQNPVLDEIPVIFTCDSAFATIDNGVIGNRNRDGEATPGVAYSRIRYHSMNTFKSVTIRASVGAPEAAIESHASIILPLQRGRVILAADPANWMFDRARAGDTCLVRVWATVRDGHDVAINGAPVIFNTDKARLYWKNVQTNRYIPFAPEPARRYTGLVNGQNNEPNGVATVSLRGVMNDFYLDDFTLEVVVRVNAQVEGYDDAVAEPVAVRMSRH